MRIAVCVKQVPPLDRISFNERTKRVERDAVEGIVNPLDRPALGHALALRERAGGEAYTGGFLGHHALSPLGLDVGSPAVQAGIYTVALVPNVLGYGLLVARGGRGGVRTGRGRRARGTDRAGPDVAGMVDTARRWRPGVAARRR